MVFLHLHYENNWKSFGFKFLFSLSIKMFEETTLKFSAGAYLNYLKNLTQNKCQILRKQKSPCICAYVSAK